MKTELLCLNRMCHQTAQVKSPQPYQRRQAETDKGLNWAPWKEKSGLNSWERKTYCIKSHAQKNRARAKITGGSKRNEFRAGGKEKDRKSKEAPPAERNGIFRSQQRGSAALRIMSQKKLREMFGVKRGGERRERSR